MVQIEEDEVLQENIDSTISNKVDLNDDNGDQKLEYVEDNTDLYELKYLNLKENDNKYHKYRRKHTFGRELKNIYERKSTYYLNNIHDNNVTDISE